MALVRERAAKHQAFVWSDGVQIEGTSIWCDARRRQQLCFVSHAHLPLTWRGDGRQRLLATERTLALRRALGGAVPAHVLPSPFCRPFALGRLRLELLPSGHVPGAAQLLVEQPERTVLYAGDVNPLPGRIAEPPQVRACEALALEAPLAPLLSALPPRAEVEAQLVFAVRAALDDGVLPVVLAPSLGGAAEVAALLHEAGVPFRTHRRLSPMLSVLRAGGAPVGEPATFRSTPTAGEALLWPLEARDAAPLRKLARARLLLAAGEALAPDAARRLGVHAAFPLSDHGDLPSLVAYAQSSGARDVYFTAGLTDEVERAFRVKKLRVHALLAPAQLPLLAHAT
jgi:putative mRNA 3-end processing factor